MDFLIIYFKWLMLVPYWTLCSFFCCISLFKCILIFCRHASYFTSGVIVGMLGFRSMRKYDHTQRELKVTW